MKKNTLVAHSKQQLVGWDTAWLGQPRAEQFTKNGLRDSYYFGHFSIDGEHGKQLWDERGSIDNCYLRTYK